MCNTILEAMVCGTPVIARRNHGNCSLLDHGCTGLLFDTPAEFKQCVLELFDGDGGGDGDSASTPPPDLQPQTNDDDLTLFSLVNDDPHRSVRSRFFVSVPTIFGFWNV